MSYDTREWPAKLAKSRTAAAQVKHGADPNTRDDIGWTLLHVASVAHGNLKVAQRLLELLLELDVDVNSRENRGQTSLQVGLRYNHE
jgi:ankyrin repeat protein